MDAVRLPSSRAPLVVTLVVLLLLGAAAAAVAYVRTRTPGAGSGVAAQTVAAAEAALSAGRLTTASGDGAVELLERAIAADPEGGAVVDLRNRLVARLESDADQARREGRLTAARDCLRLLLRLEPAHARARSALENIEATLAGPGGTPTASPPSLQTVSGPSGATDPSAPPGPAASGVPSVAVSAAETAFVGRAVHLTARLSGAPAGAAFAEPKFRLSRRGPGESAVDLPATTGGDPGTFVAEFAFPKAGTWDVVFSLSSSGSLVEGRFALAVHVPGPGGPFTTGGGGGAEADAPDGGTATQAGGGGTDEADGGAGGDDPPVKIIRRRRPPPPAPDAGGGGGRWM